MRRKECGHAFTLCVTLSSTALHSPHRITSLSPLSLSPLSSPPRVILCFSRVSFPHRDPHRLGPTRLGLAQSGSRHSWFTSSGWRRGESGFSIDRGAETSDARNVAFNKEQTVATATTSPALPSALCSLPIKLMKKKRKERWRDSEGGVKEV